MNKEITEEEQNKAFTIITALASAQLLTECLDEVKETAFYRQSLKATINKTINSLEKLCKTHSLKLWNTDEEVMNLIINGIEEIAKEMATINPEKIIKLGQLLKNDELLFIEND